MSNYITRSELTEPEIEGIIQMHKNKIAELKKTIEALKDSERYYGLSYEQEQDKAKALDDIRTLDARVLDLQEKLNHGAYKKNGGKRKSMKRRRTHRRRTHRRRN